MIKDDDAKLCPQRRTITDLYTLLYERCQLGTAQQPLTLTIIHLNKVRLNLLIHWTIPARA